MKGDWFVIINISTGICKQMEGVRLSEGHDTSLYICGDVMDQQMKDVDPDQLRKQLSRSIADLQTINGTFGGVLVTPEYLLMICDRPTTGKVYFTVHEGVLYASNHPDTVARCCPRIPEMNLTAWSEMLIWGGLLHHHTYYQEISTNSVGEVSRVNRKTGMVDWQQYDTVWGKGIIRDQSVDQAAGEIINSLKEIIGHAYNNRKKRMAATLTAGLDSRLLVGIARDLGIDLPMITTNTDNHLNEFEIMKPLLEYWGVQTAQWDVETGYYPQYAKRCLERTGGECFRHTWFSNAAEQMKDNEMWYMMGISGGELIQFHDAHPEYHDAIQFFANSDLDAAAGFFECNAYGFAREVLTGQSEILLYELYSKSLRKSLEPYMGSPRGAADWVLLNKYINYVLYIYPMFRKELSGFAPYMCFGALDLFLTRPVDDSDRLRRALYQQVDPKLLNFPSTRAPQEKEHFRSSRLHCKDVTDWIENELSESYLIEGGLVDRTKLKAHFDRMKRTNKYYVGQIRAFLAMHYWLNNYYQLRGQKLYVLSK